jgi:flagellar hook-length control protein FliK
LQDVRPPSSAAASGARRELTVYDTPEKRSPDDEARDRAKHVESHPFLYYLSQFVPGMRPQDAQAPDSGTTGSGAIGEALSATSGTLNVWSQSAANRLFDGSQVAAPVSETRFPSEFQTAIVSNGGLNAFAVLPQQAVAEPEAILAPVAAPEIPRIAFGQVERMMQNGAPASTLKIQLDPPHLGRLDMAFTYTQQKVTVNVIAATQQAKEHLDMQLSQIRAILQGHNLQTGEMKVMLASEAGGSGAQGGNSEQDPGSQQLQQQRYRRRRRAASLDEAISGI